MPDKELIKEKLLQVRTAMERILRRSSNINDPQDFQTSDDNLDRLDAIAMMLIAIGENFKKIDRETDGTYLALYHGIDWQGIKGIRDILSHSYFDIDSEVVFQVCRTGIPELLNTVNRMISDLEQSKIPF